MTLSDINVYHRGGLRPEDAANPVPEAEREYPEPWMFGTVPAKGFYVRHARDIKFDNVNFRFAQPDSRPLFVTDDAEGLRFRDIFADGEPANYSNITKTSNN